MTKPASAKNWKGPYLEKAAVDPWDRAYEYARPGQHHPTAFDLRSKGPDEDASDDDVTNWDD